MAAILPTSALAYKTNPVGGGCYIIPNSRALDVYCWLAFRLPYLDKDTPISWAALRPQFGAGISLERNFRLLFADDLRLALSVYPEARAELTPAGVLLRPSPPPLPTRHPRLLAKASP